MQLEAEPWPPEAEWLEYFKTLSNWGRWGEDDTRGTLNLVTGAKTTAACALVEDGIAVSCARTIAFGRNPSPEAMGRPMIHYFSEVAQNAPSEGGYGSSDWIGIPVHGGYITHIDAPAHIVWDGMMYNGQPASAVTPEFGARLGSVEPLENGVVTRGVLLDIARLHGRESLAAHYPIGARDLDAACREQNVELEPGDLLMVRTGYGSQRRRGKAASGGSSEAGLGVRALPWLRERDVALTACDTPTEAYPSQYTFLAPFHAVALCAMGAWLIDNADLEALSTACVERGRWEFLVMVAALRLKNCTGSPVNPVAVF